ncbi:hypothetical protein [Microbacterium dauci]|uniref:Lipoprotein n=1 Tax=Microbacterium dauci TaxID=3048008 RepID=A0ABT6ZGP3_9MICO|nr:hypothetical protein [Microbacterium sp. LX3-4]MDJ1115328.1 hypothetical protein [Microbacterium sp. LX3-4]
MTARRVCAPALLAAVFLLMGCAPAEFAREQTAADRPAFVLDGAGDAIDESTLRYVGVADGYDVYFALGADNRDTLCLTLAVGDVWQSTDCAHDHVSVRLGPAVSVSAEFNYRSGEGREMLSQNVWVNRK